MLFVQEVEPQISEACSGLLRRLEEDDQDIAAKLDRIARDEVQLIDHWIC